MKKIKLLKSIIVISLCLSMAFACSINTFALSTGPKASNKTYNSTYYMIDGRNITSKSSSGSARRFYLSATTTKRSNLASIYSSNPYNSASSSILYTGSGDISCTVNPNAGFPLGTRTKTVSGTESYCEIYVAVTYNGKAKSTGTITCRKPYASGTISANVEAY